MNICPKCNSEIAWIPTPGEEYWYIDDKFEAKKTRWEFGFETARVKMGNCFKTNEEAREIATKMLALLKPWK